MQLCEAGFPANVLRGAGFTLPELVEAGGSLGFLREAGFQVPELMEAGYSIDALKKAGVTAAQLRREAHVPFADIKAAGYTPMQLRESGFGPGELREAGFTLQEIKEAGFSAEQLIKKSGFSLRQLKRAGYSAAEIVGAGANVTPAELIEAGFPASGVKTACASAFSSSKSDGSSQPTSFFAASRQAKKGAAAPLKLPEKVVVGLEGLLRHPPAAEVIGPSRHVYSKESTSLFCLRPAQEPRRAAIFFVESRPFDPIVLITIMLNCCTMAWESPLDPPGTWKAHFIDQCESVFLWVYTVEMLTKMLAYGLFWHRSAYLRDPWCQLDFIVVTLAWIPILTSWQMTNASVVRSVRALRPLRALKTMPEMRMLVGSILEILPKMGSVSMLCGFVFLVFGIVGVQLFQGALHYRCALPGAPDFSSLSAEVQLQYDTETFCNPSCLDSSCLKCEENQQCVYFDANLASQPLMSFDNVPIGFVLLLQAVTFDDWATSMFALMDAYSPYVIIYYVLIIIVGGFFVVNLFLAVIFEEFISSGRVEKATEEMEARGKALQEEEAAQYRRNSRPPSELGSDISETALLVENQFLSDYKDTERSPPHAGPATPRTRTYMLLAAASSPKTVDRLLQARSEVWREPDILYKISVSSSLSSATMALVLINMLLMCLPYEGMSEAYAKALEQTTTTITFLFIGEMIVKLCGLGFTDYWSDGWNALDGTIVILSVAEMVINDMFASAGVPKMSFLRILRMLRVARVLKLMRSWKELYRIIATFGKALPQMSNLFMLTFLCMVILALLGMQLFGGMYNPETGFSDVPCPGGVCPNPDLQEVPHYYFDYFVPSMATVFVLMTGEWIDATNPAAAVGGAKVLAYFIPAVIIGRYLIMNLFIGILLNAFAEEEEEEEVAPDSAALAAPSEALATIDEGADEVDEVDRPKEEPRWPEDHSLCLFGPRNPLRVGCLNLVTYQHFDTLIILVICASSFCLALDVPRLDPLSPLGEMLHQLDYVWTAIFFLEMCLKIVAYGFISGKEAYLRSAWNQLDFLIVVVTVLVIVAESVPELYPLRTLRILRILRPLRLISRIAGMRVIVASLVKALPSVFNVFMVVIAVQSVFAILGMQLFMGRFGSCTDPTLTTKDACHSAAPAGRALRGGSSGGGFESGDTIVWLNPRIGSFDNFGEAMRLLYIMSSGDEWEAPMYMMMAATEPGHAPVRNDYSPAAFFSIAWMFVGSFFALNLFVGVIVDSFDRIKKESDSSATMTAEQQQWVKTMQAMANQAPVKGKKPPTNRLRKLLYDLINSASFDLVISIVIVLNIMAMACDFWGIENYPNASSSYALAMRIFTNIYYTECIIKLLALSPAGYFDDSWNRFDFFLVSTAMLDDFANVDLSESVGVPPFILRVLRVFRILRILRLLKGAKDVRDLIVTAILSFPSLINVGSLLSLVVFIYSVLGVQAFTFLAHQENINDDRNFDTVQNAALLLFQVLTGDAWSGLMADAMLAPVTGECSVAEGDCGSPLFAICFFVSFQILGTFVFLNLVVAVILENFSSLGSLNPEIVSPADVESFKEVWAAFDPDADNFIPSEDLPLLVLALPPPMGLKGVGNERAAIKLCLKLSLTQYDGKAAFQEVLNALTRKSFFAKANADDLVKLDAPPPPKPPPLPLGFNTVKPLPSTEADKFAMAMPSVRKVFALQVIAKHATKLIEVRKRAEQAKLDSMLRGRVDVTAPTSKKVGSLPQVPAGGKKPLSKRVAAAGSSSCRVLKNAAASGISSVRGKLRGSDVGGPEA